MESHYHNGEHPRPVYHTPTKSSVKVLEEMVAQRSSSSRTSKSSTSTSHRSTQSMNKGKNTPPFPPLSALPNNPPAFDPRNAPQLNTPPLPPLPPDLPTSAPTPPPEDNVRNHRERSTKSHRSKQTSKSLPRRLVEELEHMQHRKNSMHGASPTDSHPGRHPHENPHGRARSSSDSISNLLVVTTERLSQETARANEAERHAAEILALFKKTHEAKARLERDFNRVREELGLYKVQLDVAQREIFRAQEIVDRVERERAAAEEEAARARDKVHKLNEVRAVEHALAEGRQLGFDEGLKQGRFLQPRSVSPPRNRRKRNDDHMSEVSQYTYPEGETTRSSSAGSSHRRKSSLKSHMYSAYPQRPTSTNLPARQDPPQNTRPRRGSSAAPPPPEHPHGTPPDVGHYSDLLPRPTVTTPMPFDIPTTQPQAAPPMPPHQPPNPVHDHTKSPENIAVQPSRDPNEPIHPIPVWNHTPSVKHERIIVPPDNYIPTMDAHSMISLPPPHELSLPVAPEAPPPSLHHEPITSRPRSRSRAGEHDDRAGHHRERQAERGTTEYSYRSRGDDATSLAHTARTGGNEGRKYATMPSRTMSVLSRGSTRLSELDLLSPPRDGEVDARGKDRYREEVESPTLRRSVRPRAPFTQSPTVRMAEEWRSANKDYLRPISPPDSHTSKKYDTGTSFKVNGVEKSESIFPRPPSSTSRQNQRPPRRPREIVLPAPLAEVLMNTPSGGRSNLPLTGEMTLSTPPHLVRAATNATVPGIEVVTPSTHASQLSERTIVDPVLLTPDSANRPIALPTQPAHDGAHDSSLGLYFDPHKPGDDERISMVLPDNNLPPGFVPLSPMPGMANINPYPPGFAPNMPKDHPGSMSPNFTYPSSPLVRPA